MTRRRILTALPATILALAATLAAARGWREFNGQSLLTEAGFSIEADETREAGSAASTSLESRQAPGVRLELLRRARSQKSVTSAASVGLARVRLRQATEGSFNVAGAPLADALGDVRNALEASPANTEAWMAGYRIVETARTLGQAGRLPLEGAQPAAVSRRFLDGALRTDPNGVDVQRELAFLLMAAGDREGAWTHYRRALSLVADPAKLARQMIGAGYGPQEVAAAMPQQALPQYELGRILQSSGETSLAEAAFRRAVELEPGRWESWRALSNLAESAGRHADALAYAKSAFPLLPALQPAARAEILQCAAIAARGAGDEEEAKGYAKRAIEEDPEHLFAYNLAATLCYETGDLAEAIRIWKALIETHGRDPYVVKGLGSFHRSMGRSYEKLEMNERAREHYRAAIAASASDPESRQALERLARRR